MENKKDEHWLHTICTKVIQGFKICFLSRANAPFDSSLQVTEETNGKSSPDNDLSAR